MQCLLYCHSFIHSLSNSLEKTLRHKSNSTTKRQHVHGCRLVRAKRLYGYHSSEELFVKAYLYYPHDVARAASLLLDGSVLGKVFQPYESHIPYLLQFLIDCNLYGMNHLHASAVKFRSPLPDCYNAVSTNHKKIDMLTTSSDHICGEPKIWISSTVPSALIWPDSTSLLDNTNNKFIHLTRRQSIYGIELDVCVEDIINEKFKIYTPLSQTSLEAKMVQSLIPIWEEEHERSGVLEAVKRDDHNKPLPCSVLRSFMDGLHYIKALSDACIESCTSSSKLQVDGEETLDAYIKSFNDISQKMELTGEQKLSRLSDDFLICGKEGNLSGKTSSSSTSIKENMKDLEYEAEALLNWLASSQADKEMDAGDEMLHEAILSPLFPQISYKDALEIAHRDYERASQQECKDILDSVEELLKSEVSNEQASSSSQDIILDSAEGIGKPAGSKEEVSSLDFFNVISSGLVIPQIDGSFDDDCSTSRKGNIYEHAESFGGEKYAAQPSRQAPADGRKTKENKLLWGTLPFSVQHKEHKASDFDSFCAISSLQNASAKFSPNILSCHTKGNYSESVADAEIFGKKDSNALALCSVRDLLRRKRHLRGEQAEAVFRGCEGLATTRMEETMAGTSMTGGHHLVPCEESLSGQSISHQDVEGGISCSINFSSGFQVMEDFERHSTACDIPTLKKSFSPFLIDKAQSGILSSVHTMVSNVAMHDNTRNVKEFSTTDLSVPETELKQLSEVLESNTLASLLYATLPGVCDNQRPFSTLNITKCDSGSLEKNSTEIRVLKSHPHESRNADNVENKYSSKIYGNAAQMYPELYSRSWQESDVISDDVIWDFNAEKTSQEFVEASLSIKPPIIEHVGRPESSLSDKQRWMDDIEPFFPRISQWLNSHEENITLERDSLLGIPTHFQNDGSVLYLLTHALSPPTINSVNDWLSREITQLCMLGTTGATCCQSLLPEVSFLKSEALQSNQEKYSTESTSLHLSKNQISREPKLESSLVQEKVSDDLHDISQLSGPEKYEKCYLTPLSQIGFRDPASVESGQQLTFLSMELQAESRGNLRPDPKFDAINILALVVQEDMSNGCQVYVFLRIVDEKSGVKLGKNGNDGFNGNMFLFTEEKLLVEQVIEIICSLDPDMLMGWDIQGGSLGYLAERSLHLGVNLLKKISRTPLHEKTTEMKNSGYSNSSDLLPEVAEVANVKSVLEVVEDEWGRDHASGLHVGGRIVLNIWRLMRAELKLNMYTVEAVTEGVLRQKIPLLSDRVLNQWYSSDLERARCKCIEYVVQRAMLNIEIMDQLDMISRTSELARIFGIDFSSVISRGSQFRVESMLLRLSHTQNYVAISPGYQQVASQPAMECLPLVMEPESGFYDDPVVVLDFQSLYPSMIIAYNICFSTCLGNVLPARANVLGVSSYSQDVKVLKDLREMLLLTPNGVMYVPPKVRKGVLPRLLEEILSTRIMVKQAMKKLKPSQQILRRILDARQLALKLIANVTYGYTAAGFSGRMPCAEIADSIVQCGRRTLETAIEFVNHHEQWKAKVIYGDTDSMFVLLKGRSREDAFRIGHEIANAITAMNPEPVTLKMEKVYQPCFLLTKKRYVGYSYESIDQKKPSFDAKGIETVRRDTCPAVAKTLERTIRLFFENQDLSEVKTYLHRQWRRILSGKVSLKDFVFAKEVRLGTYSSRASSLPPAAIVAKKAIQIDPRAKPSYGERVPYVVVHGEPGSRLVDMVVDPYELLDINSPYRLNDLYYIRKQMIPALQRVFGLFGVDLNQWFSEIPRPNRSMFSKQPSSISHMGSIDDAAVSRRPPAKRRRIDTYYASKHCSVCGELVQSSAYVCVKCFKNKSLVAATVVGRTSKKERELQHLVEICNHCGGGDWAVESGVKCVSLACSVFYERRKVQKEVQTLSSFAAATGFYTSCTAEFF
ncbi:hypothetical protein HPP92_001324 [Vanilla planifolia]|uniref:DNA polymerase n=1 Tax=Vanilla planifolia TaxID=51239 RepID=A0A835RTS1_VANPL|nr:hypothetical protein HPP92_001324 [Vanilla planifolia]